MSQASDLVVALLDAQIPGSTPKLRAAVLFQVVSEYCREVLQKAPPADFTSEPAGWLTDPEWLEHHTTILSGALARLYVMPNKPWTNTTAAQAHATLYQYGFARSREVSSTAATNVIGYNRLMANIRMLVPNMRDGAIHQELFNTVEDFQRNVRQGVPPDHTKFPDQWLSADDYNTFFGLLLAGTLSRIYGQSNKPWTDPKAELARRATYEQEVIIARADAQAEDAARPTDRLLSSLRSQLPGIKDTAIYPALFDVINEACRQHFIWIEVVRIRLAQKRQVFKITPSGCDLVRVSDMQHPKLSEVPQVDPVAGTLAIMEPITEEMTQQPIVIRMMLAPSITSKSEDAVNWIPSDLWGRFHQLLLEGCLHKLMLQPVKPWTDTKLGAVHGQVYRQLLFQATREARTEGMIPQRQNWLYPRWA